MFVDGARPLSTRRLTACDEYLTGAATELLDHDDRLRDIAVDVRFDRGVAHLTGAVADPGQLRLVRELIGRLGGVLAVWSRVRVAGREPVIVDLGCGQTKQYPGSIGVDRQAGSTVDVLADLAHGLPFADCCMDVVFAVHVLEHLVDFLPLVDECDRVLGPDGMWHVLSPWWRFDHAGAHPTHLPLPALQTVSRICSRRPGHPPWYPAPPSSDDPTMS